FKHRRKLGIGFAVRQSSAREQGKIVLVADTPKRPQRPQCFAAGEGERAEGIRLGQALEHGEAKLRSQPEIEQRGESALGPGLLDELRILLLKAGDLAKA